MRKRTTGNETRERSLLVQVCRALDDKKAGDLKVIDVRGLSSITDHLVVATGLAEPHLRAMRIAVEQVLDANGARIAGMDTNQGSGWLVVDAYQIMVHLFTAEVRQKFALEQLWRDAKELPVADLLAPAEAPAAPRKRSPRTGAAKSKRTGR